MMTLQRIIIRCLALLPVALLASCLGAEEPSTEPSLDQYVQEWTFSNYFQRCLHPLDVEPENFLLTCAESSLGFLSIPFLLIEDLHTLPKAEEYPYLDHTICADRSEGNEKISQHYSFLRLALYATLNFVVLLILSLCNVSLIVGLLSGIMSAFLVSIIRLGVENIWLPTLIGILPILLGARIIYRIQHEEELQEKIEELKTKMKEKKKTILFSAFFGWLLLYFIISAARLQLRVEENKKRFKKGIGQKKKEKTTLEKQINALKKQKQNLIGKCLEIRNEFNELEEGKKYLQNMKNQENKPNKPYHCSTYSRYNLGEVDKGRSNTPPPSHGRFSSRINGYPNLKASAPLMSPDEKASSTSKKFSEKDGDQAATYQ